jgi:hypothetical protein
MLSCCVCLFVFKNFRLFVQGLSYAKSSKLGFKTSKRLFAPYKPKQNRSFCQILNAYLALNL